MSEATTDTHNKKMDGDNDLGFGSDIDIGISDISPANEAEDISEGDVENFKDSHDDTIDNILRSNSEDEEPVNNANQKDNNNSNNQYNPNNQTPNQNANPQTNITESQTEDELGLPSFFLNNDSSEYITKSEYQIDGPDQAQSTPKQTENHLSLSENDEDDGNKGEAENNNNENISNENEEERNQNNEETGNAPANNMTPTKDQDEDSFDSSDMDEDHPGYLTQKPNDNENTPKKEIIYNKSYKAFLERNDNSAMRHYDPSVPRPPSPRTIHYKKSPPKSPPSPQKKGLPRCQSPRLSELCEKGIKPKKTYAPPEAPPSPMSEATMIFAQNNSERQIDLIIGKKNKLNHIQMASVLRKLCLRAPDVQQQIEEKCGIDDEYYDANILRGILKEATSQTAEDGLAKKIRPTVKAALFDMKKPIVSPMTQKQRAEQNFDKTLRSSSRMHSSPK